MAIRKKSAKKTTGRTAKRSAGKTAKRKTAARAAAKSRTAPARRKAAPRAPRGGMRLAAASPSFTVNDLEKSIAFYRDVLGFAVKQRWEEGGRLLGVEMAAGNVIFMLGQDDWKKGRDRQKGVGFRVYCSTTQDVDALAAKVKERGGALDYEPETSEWGRHFAFTDPDGFKVTIAKEARRRR